MFRLSYNSANKVYPDGKEDWFIRDVNLSNEQTAFLANDQQLLDVQRFCTNSELFSVFFRWMQHSMLPNIFFWNIPELDARNIPRNKSHLYRTWSSAQKKARGILLYSALIDGEIPPETRGVLVVGTDGEESIWKAMNNVFSDAVHLRCDISTLKTT